MRFIVALVLLSACAAPPVDENAATAFGRVEFVEDGKEAIWSRAPLADELTLFVRAVGTGKIRHFEIAGDGSFDWQLPAGEYELLGFQFRRKFRGPGTGVDARLMLRFSLRQPGQAVYIGNLRIDWEKAGYRFAVHDRGQRPTKELMRAEEAGRFKLVTPICSASWGTHCDKTHQGVRPLQPDGTAWTFSEARTLTPLLEWEPSSRSGVTYDLAIYESLWFAYGLKSVNGLRATRVAYVEGLREPRYQAALEPGKKYEWSVRLRDGDTVSEWSTTSYAFAGGLPGLYFAGYGSGKYFGIATPAR